MKPTYEAFVNEEIRMFGRAWVAANPDDNNIHDPEHMFEKIGDLAWRRLVDNKSARQVLTEIGVNPDDYLPSQPVPEFPARTGVVSRDGRSWHDDGGLFYPLGNTLFWALSGWMHERDRLGENLGFLNRMGFDYARITGDLDWAGQDASDPNFEANLGALLDAMHGDYGLRAEITAFAGPSPRDPLMVARKVASVVQSRRDKVLFVEAANESAKSGPENDATLDEMVRILKSSGAFVASSAPMGGDWGAWLDARHADVATLHLDRSEGDDDWRFVRQPWDFRFRSDLGSNNEGKGPRSSISESVSPTRLCAYRLVSIMTGLSAFCLHNGAGVAGKVDPAHNRPANLWEVPTIERIMQTLRGLDKILPEGIENWSKGTQHGGWNFPGYANLANPFTADAIWSDGHGHGASRCYGVRRNNIGIAAVFGIDQYVTLRNEMGPCECSAYDLDTQQAVIDRNELTAGANIRLNATTGRDAAYLVIGIG